jgi:hypothetical protein
MAMSEANLALYLIYWAERVPTHGLWLGARRLSAKGNFLATCRAAAAFALQEFV